MWLIGARCHLKNAGAETSTCARTLRRHTLDRREVRALLEASRHIMRVSSTTIHSLTGQEQGRRRSRPVPGWGFPQRIVWSSNDEEYIEVGEIDSRCTRAPTSQACLSRNLVAVAQFYGGSGKCVWESSWAPPHLCEVDSCASPPPTPSSLRPCQSDQQGVASLWSHWNDAFATRRRRGVLVLHPGRFMVIQNTEHG